MSGTIAAILKWAEYFLGRNFGYSQAARWTGLKDGKPHEPGDFDCTSIIGAILYLAGYIKLSLLSGTWYSGNLASKLQGAGWKRVSAKGRSLAWLNANVAAGCVLVGPGHGVLGLGGGYILSWEYSERGTIAGKVGRQSGEKVGKRKLYLRSKGWADLLIPPADKTLSTVVPLALRAAHASQEAQHFGGPADYTSRGRWMAKLGASLIGTTETTVTAKGKTAWSGRVAMQKGLGKVWKRTTFLALCLYYDSGKYTRSGTVRSAPFGPKSDIWHGAMVVPVTRKDAKVRIDVGVVHIRPKAVATDTQKRADVAKALALVDPTVPTILCGDWAGNWDAEMAAAGFTRASLRVDTYDDAGVQTIDAVYLSHHLSGDLPKLLDPGAWSDHKWVSVRVTKPSTTTL
jgi:hypothetical protein